MIKAIQEEYTVPVKKKGRPKKNKFNNFKQRNYDFEALERMLLLNDVSEASTSKA